MISNWSRESTGEFSPLIRLFKGWSKVLSEYIFMVKHRRGNLRAKEAVGKPMRLARDGIGLKNHWRLIMKHGGVFRKVS